MRGVSGKDRASSFAAYCERVSAINEGEEKDTNGSGDI